jgi:ABC-type transport system substrate-binding protein
MTYIAKMILGVVPWGTIRVAVKDFGAEALDPTMNESVWSWSLCDSLITTDADGNYVPEVAGSWTISPDGLTWTFYIREDITFHNGDPLTAEDVLFTMQRFTSDNSTNPWSASLKANLSSMRLVNPYTFELVTDVPELPLISSFAQARIIPKNYFESVGADGFNAHPVGSGPWKFVSHIPELSFTMEANMDYWDVTNIPDYKYVEEYQVSDDVTQMAMFKNGEIDMAMGLTTAQREQLEDEGYRMQRIGLDSPVSLNIQGTWFPEAGPTNDIRIRQALSYAINRQELCDTYYGGDAVPGGQFALMTGGYGATPELIAPDAYSLTLATQLMTQAGYPDAFADPVIHLYTTAGSTLDFMLLIQAYWQAAGFQVHVEVLEATVWLAYFFDPNGMVATDPNVGWIWAWTGGAFDSSYMQKNLLCTTGVHNVGHDANVDALWDTYISNTNAAASEQLFTDFLTAGYATKRSIGLVMLKPLYAVSDKLGQFTTNTHLNYSDCYSGIKHP